jgi:hypothetical protein
MSSSIPLPGPDGLYHPASTAEVAELIRFAADRNRRVRVRGSLHSPAAAILAPPKPARPPVNIKLDRMRSVRFETTSDPAQLLVHVEAGCHLGADPMDNGAPANEGLLHQLVNHGDTGWALPDLGGITHQTVSGFLSTGSSGSTLRHSNYDNLVGLEIVDGTGAIHHLTRDSGDDKFFAAGISLGLLGVVTKVTLKCIPRYHIKGEWWNQPVNNCGIDLFGPGSASEPSLADFLKQHEYARVLWWPQKGVERVAVWTAHRMQTSEYNGQTGTPDQFTPNPFPLFTGGNPQLTQAMARFVLLSIRHSPQGPLVEGLASMLLSLFVPDEPKTPFWDHWYTGLPMDNQINERLLPLEFTEMKFPLAQAPAVMQALRTHYASGELKKTGTLACELYAAKRSDFWLSSSYGDDVLKVDLLWFKDNPGSPDRKFFPQFWDLLRPYDFKLHWGKYLPSDTRARGKRSRAKRAESWVDYLRRQYPKWDDFMTLRTEMDPHDLFATPYWQQHLGI